MQNLCIGKKKTVTRLYTMKHEKALFNISAFEKYQSLPDAIKAAAIRDRELKAIFKRGSYEAKVFIKMMFRSLVESNMFKTI